MAEETQDQIRLVAENLGKLVVEKNRRYGDSALSPLRIFSKHQKPMGELLGRSDSEVQSYNQILTRLDDKLKRVQNADELRKNDVADVMGYLTLLCVRRKWLDFTDLLD